MMVELKEVVVGVDFSDASRAAVAQAVRLAASAASAQKGRVRVVHVVERSLIHQLSVAFGEKDPRVEARALEWPRGTLEQLVADAAPASEGEGGPEISFEVVVGSTAAELARIAGESKADLLVIGSVGRDHVAGGVGTTAARCVRHATTDVLLVHPEKATPFRHIVACLDFSDTSARALRSAVEIARRDGAKVDALHVLGTPVMPPPPIDPVGLWPSTLLTSDYPEMVARVREEAERSMKQAVERAQEYARGEVTITPVLTDDPSYARGIVEHATNSGADLVAIGTQGHSNLRYVLLGSTAERVLRHVGCSVLAVRPSGEAK